MSDTIQVWVGTCPQDGPEYYGEWDCPHCHLHMRTRWEVKDGVPVDKMRVWCGDILCQEFSLLVKFGTYIDEYGDCDANTIAMVTAMLEGRCNG